MKKLLRFLGVGVILLASLLPCLTISPTVSATGNISYGMYEYCQPLADDSGPSSANVSWYIASNFDWIAVPFFYSHVLPEYANLSSLLNAGGKEVILRTWFWGDTNLSVATCGWNGLYTSLLGNRSFYNSALNSVKNQINNQGVSNLYAITISEEELDAGYGFNVSLYNVSRFTAVYNQLYTDIKATYPTLKIFANIHIASFTNGELAALNMDGIFDDRYTEDLTVLGAWYSRMLTYGGSETYCLLHSSGGLDAVWYDEITPAVVRDEAKLADALNVPHLGWYAFDSTLAWPNIKSILFYPSFPSCSWLNDPYCALNYRGAILGVVNHSQNIFSIDRKINASTDDAGTRENIWMNNSGYGTLGSYWNELTKTGFLFRNVVVPTVGSFRLSEFRLYSNGIYDTKNASVSVYAENTSNPVTFSTEAEFINRSKTTAFIPSWNTSFSEGWGEAVPYLNVSSLIQELLSRYNYSGGANMSLLMYGIDGGDVENISSLVTYDAGPAYGAELHLEYDMPIYVGNYTAVANGSISGDSPQNIYYGENGSTVTAVPNACYHFTSWSDAVATASRTDTNVLANISVTANFAIDTFTLTYINGSNGGITGTLLQTVNCSSNGSTVTAVPNTGYSFVDWSDTSTDNPRTDTGVVANLSVTANFTLNAPPTSIGGIFGTLISIVVSACIIFILLGFAFSEFKQDNIEGMQVAIVGILAVIIVETIIIACL